MLTYTSNADELRISIQGKPVSTAFAAFDADSMGYIIQVDRLFSFLHGWTSALVGVLQLSLARWKSVQQHICLVM